jgi:hypothetical protein
LSGDEGEIEGGSFFAQILARLFPRPTARSYKRDLELWLHCSVITLPLSPPKNNSLEGVPDF